MHSKAVHMHVLCCVAVELGKTESSSVTEEDHTTFLQWLRCYNNPDMSIMKDKFGRTIWFHVMK